MDIIYQIYLGVLTIVALTTIVSLKQKFSYPVKIIVILVLYTCLVEWSVFLKFKFFSDKTSANIYNCFMLAQYLGFAYYFQQIIRFSWIRKAIQFFLYLYPVFWYLLVFFVFKPSEWNSYVYMVGGMFTILWAASYCYQLLNTDDPVALQFCSEFWIAIGLIFFYMCSVPYMGMFNFLIEVHNDLAALLRIPLQISNIVMYTLFSYAFICQLTATKRS